MKISLLIAAIIVGIAAYFGLDQKEKIKHLTTEWEELKTTAIAKSISTDPKATFSSQRARSDSARAAREKAISDFAGELAAFAQKMEADEKDGDVDQAARQNEIISFLDKLSNMSSSDLKSLVKVLSEDTSIKEETKQELLMMSIMMLSTDNPEAALALISESDESLGLENRNQHLLPMVIAQFTAKDPDAAAAWVVENGDQLGDQKEEMKVQLITAAAQNNFESALTLIKTLGLEDKNKSYSILGVGVKAGDQDRFLAALEANNLSEEGRQAALSSLALSAFIREDFQAASIWLDNPELSTTDKNTIVSNFHYHSVKDSAKEWLGWINQQENSNSFSERATGQIISGWTQENFVAAGEWLQTQEDGPNKNIAVKTYAEILAPHEPAAAADWAITLPEGDERNRLLRSIHSSMKAKDLEAASAFAEEHQLKVE